MVMDPIAVIGFAFKLPQEAVDDSTFWDVLENRRNLMTEWPVSRATKGMFYDGGYQKQNTLHSRGAHFLKEDPAVFDAPFFSITSKEAAAMDPQQRWVLETAYHAFENAGIPLQELRGSSTAVFGASMSDDYSRIFAKDPDTTPLMAATGIEPSCLPNRISWRVNPYAMGMHPHFDKRANGYARGEGIVAMVVKPLRLALRDGDVIRAVIRATGSNQDGRTPGLTQPSAEAQEILIRNVYQKAGLSLEDTRYVEAHGTGTPTGDPIEMKAIGRVFRKHRSRQDPMFVGSVKANIGHLEAGSGLAGLIKTILALEKGVIPPNALFEKMNPAIDAEFYHLQVPTESLAWPTAGLRRASVNSFGFGGSNAHAVVDDALHYLKSHGLTGYHNCTTSSSQPDSFTMHGTFSGVDDTRYLTDETLEKMREDTEPPVPKLLVWTAADLGGIERVLSTYQEYYQNRISGRMRKLDQLAYTLAMRRSHMLWRSFAVVDAAHGTTSKMSNDQAPLPTAQPVRASGKKLGIAFVFTGQGAQYAGMGLELLRYPVFAETLKRVDAVLAGLGCTWSLFEALGSQERIDRPDYSQPLCTALQLALVELLKSFGVVPEVVVGHSSGEIAAAYTIGALSFESTCKVAYYRGRVAERLRATSSAPGAMMSVNLSETEVSCYIQKIEGVLPGSVHIACVNSPVNCTLSATEEIIDKIKEQLETDGKFSQKLKTGVPYHSPAMQSVASEYMSLLGSLNAGVLQGGIPMISSVTGHNVTEPEQLHGAQYWVENLVSPVRFTESVQVVAEGAALKVGMETITDIIEIGPHAALRRSVLDTLASSSRNIQYYSVLHRSKSPLHTVLSVLGSLFCRGHPVSVAAGNGHEAGSSPPPLIDCPQYPFDHSRRYWAESRLSKDYRLRTHSTNHLLGKRAHDWNALRPTYRNWLSVEGTHWLADHVISNTTICPGAGMIVMTLEAVMQSELSSVRYGPISGFLVKEARFLHPIPVAEEAQAATETCLHLRPVRESTQRESGWSEIAIFAFHDDRWTECFQALVQVQYKEEAKTQVDGGRERQLERGRIQGLYERASGSCTNAIDSVAFYEFLRDRGLAYGPTFQLLQDMHWDGEGVSTARIAMSPSVHQAGDSPVHPAVLDAAVHLIMAQVSKGMSGPTPTLVPQKLTNAWISAQPWVRVGASARLACILQENSNLGTEGSLYALGDDGSPLCAIERMLMVPVSRDKSVPDENRALDRKLLYRVEWKPQLSGLNRPQLQELCSSRGRPATPKNAAGLVKLNSVMRMAAHQAIQGLSRADSENLCIPGNIRQFAAVLKYRYGEEDDASSHWGDIHALLEELDFEYPEYRMFTVLGRNLESVLHGKMDTLELLFGSGTDMFYASVINDLCDHRFQAFLDLASHENPGLRIIEVGAGTGAMSRNVLTTLQALEQRTGSARFAEYTYTDISPAFFEAARSKFAEFADRLMFKKLDLERDPREEGFEFGVYDMIIAGSVLHATSNLAATLARLRALLRPGGHLVNLEITSPYSAWANVGFGSLPGWWLSTEEWRQHGPLVTEQVWRALVCEAGFSGLDLCLGMDGGLSLMVSTATNQEQASGVAQEVERNRSKYRLVLVIDQNQDAHRALAAHLSDRHEPVQVVDIGGMHESAWAETDVVASLLEVGTPRLAKLSKHDFQVLREFIQRTRNLLWVTAPGTEQGKHAGIGPQYGVATGLLRVIRSEEPAKHIVTLAIEALGSIDSELDHMPLVYADYIEQVIKSCFYNVPPSPELEFVVQNGHLTIGRLIHAADLEEDRRARVLPQLREDPWLPGPALALEVGTLGMLDTLRFVEDAQYAQLNDDTVTLKPHEVEIEAKAWPVSFRDVFIALGRLGQEGLGFECAGVVTRVGAEAGFQPGNRVCMVTPGCMRMYPRAPADAVFRLPDSVSFHNATAAINPGMTAYHALINVARLRRGEKILIHSAAGSTGQMAIWIAKQVGAEIFTTVGFDEKKRLLIDEFEIDADHIFYSRDTSFAQGILRVTNGYGVDVILNSLSGDSLQASWECIAPYGRFLEIGKMDIGTNASLPMRHFAKNVSFCAIDLHHIAQTNTRLTRELVQAVMDLISTGKAACPTPLHVYTVAQVEKAFRYMQSGRHTGRIIIDISHDHTVPKLLAKKSTWHFASDASYLVAGGLGGLGRAIVQWMADKGAKNLILPSRSGISSQAALSMVKQLQKRGIQILAPRCNVGLASDLAGLLQDCARAGLPPIKGCINAAMALHDAVFEGMTYTQWELTMQSKVDSSWNLHQQLPRDMDFFILLSSLSGIYGSLAQGNYAAGCTFQDALAQYRTVQGVGKKSVSLDLGWMRDVGIVAEREDYRRNRANARDMNPVESADLIALLDFYCDPILPLPEGGCGKKSQLLVGAVTPVDIRNRGGSPAQFETRPLFAGYAVAAATAGRNTQSPHKPGIDEHPAVLFQQAVGAKARAGVVVAALVKRLAHALGVAAVDIDEQRPLSEYGVDSLMAVELRNWMRHDFGAAVAVFEIMDGGASIRAVAELVLKDSSASITAVSGEVSWLVGSLGVIQASAAT
ncbi:hypothetical protein DL771_008810 [Monosporascus sp. 5C6A]|nr:hypothetical protein DL771_008810 [Monosporascus sp. 5C6A]